MRKPPFSELSFNKKQGGGSRGMVLIIISAGSFKKVRKFIG